MSIRFILAATMLAAASLTLVSCGKSPRIEGEVRDESGKPLPGAVARVEGSTFSSTTDGRGRYSIDYAPGKIVVVFAKDGHLSDTLRVELATKSHFPAAPITLLTIPKDAGFFWVSPGGYVAMEAVGLEESFQDTGTALLGGRRVTSFRANGTRATVVPAGKLRFVDHDPGDQRLFRLGSGRLIARISAGAFGLDRSGVVDTPADVARQVMPDLWIREADLTPGTYAYCTVVPLTMGGFNPTSPAYVFTVGDSVSAGNAAPTVAATPAVPSPAASGLPIDDAKATVTRFLASLPFEEEGVELRTMEPPDAQGSDLVAPITVMHYSTEGDDTRSGIARFRPDGSNGFRLVQVKIDVTWDGDYDWEANEPVRPGK